MTLPILFASWTVGAIMLLGSIWLAGFCPIKRIWGDHYLFLITPLRRWMVLLIGYLGGGFCILALPMKLLIPATSWFGVLFLTTIWPVWLVCNWLNIDILGHTSVAFQSMLFNAG